MKIMIFLLVFFLIGCGANRAPSAPDQGAQSQNNTALDRVQVTSAALPSATQAPSVAVMQEPVEEEAMAGVEAEALMAVAPADMEADDDTTQPQDMTFENYGVNPFVSTDEDHLSTFAMDVDTASYTLARSYLGQYNQFPPTDAIRPEEFINYFDVGYEGPEDDKAFAIHLDAAPSPFGLEDQYLFRVGVQGKYIDPAERDPALLIFVIDVSGSMDMENRLGLVKESLTLLVDELREDDRVGIAVYSDNSRVVLEPTPASEKETILSAINALQPEGSTNAEAGLILGYDMAEKFMREGTLTRVILCSDGVANVGNTGPDSILNRITEQVDQGITLSTIGFGMGNYNDVLMEQLANDGDGNYFYVDNVREARRVFVHNLTGTLQVIGYDAKIQVDFDADVVSRYRLIGYENRAIADTDFRNDTVDAGEVGAGHSITALYEVELKNGIEPQNTLATAYIRYQNAETREVEEMNEVLAVGDLWQTIEDAPADFRLLAAVAEFGEMLRGSEWAEGGSYGSIRALANSVVDEIQDNAQITEFVELVSAAVRLSDG